MTNKDSAKNYTITCPKKLKDKFETEFIEEKKQECCTSLNTSKIFRVLMEILLEKKTNIELSDVYDEETLKQALLKGLANESINKK